MTPWPSFDPGTLVHQVQLLRQQVGSGAAGANVSWVTFLTAYAAIEPMRGMDAIRAGQQVSQLTLTVTMRWQSGILPNMRVKSLNGTYLIQSIENIGERNIWLRMTCLGLGANE